MPTNAPTRKHPCLCCLILAFCCALLSFLPLLLQDGGKLLFMSDYLEQQIPFGMYINESIKSGQVYWSWGIDLGTNFIGAFSFYLLGSPFFWLSMPFSSSWYIYIAGIVYILKYMVAALTAFLWLRRQVNGENAALFGALLYAFSGFQSLNLIFSHFHDVAALFPLLLLAVDLWVQEGRRWPLALAACINLLTNYVFFVGEVVFLAVYYLMRWLIPDVRRGLRRLPGCMALGGLGVAMGAVLFVPSVLFLLSNPRTQQHGVSLLFSKDELLYLVRSMLLPASSMHSPDVLMENHWASCALWLPMGGLVLAVIYCFGAKKGDWLRRLFLLCLLATLSPALNGAFLLWTQSGYRRWFYMLLLLAALAAARVLEAPERYPVRRGLWIGLAGTTAFQAAMLLLPDAVRRPGLFAWNCFVADAALLALLWALPGGRRVRGRAMLAFTMAFCVLSTGTCARLYHDDRHTDGARYAAQLEAASQLTVPEGNRVRPTENRQTLPGMLMNADTFCSTVNGGIFELNELLGTPRVVRSELSGEGRAELLSAGYTVQEQPWEGSHPKSEGHADGADYYVYHDKITPPIGFAYHTYMRQSQWRRIDPELRCLAMLRTLVVRDEDVPKVEGVLRPYDPQQDGAYQPENKEDLVALRREEASETFTRDERGFCSELTCAQAGYGFYSFSYDAGWSATVNGEPVEILNICGLMAVPLQAGENRVEFRYTPPGLGLGLALTGAGWAAFALLTAQEVRQTQRKRRKARGGDEEEPAAEKIGGRNRPLAQPYP